MDQADGRLAQGARRLRWENIGRLAAGVTLGLVAIAVVVLAILLILNSAPRGCVDPKVLLTATSKGSAPRALQIRVAHSASAPAAVGQCLAVDANASDAGMNRAAVVVKPCARGDVAQQWNFSVANVGGWNLLKLQNASGVASRTGGGATAWKLVKPCAQKSIDGTCGGVVSDSCPVMLTNSGATYQAFTPCSEVGGGGAGEQTVEACTSGCPSGACGARCPQVAVGPAVSLADTPDATFLLNTRPTDATPTSCGFIMQEAVFNADDTADTATAPTWSIDPTSMAVQWQQAPSSDLVVSFVEVDASPLL